MTTRTLMLLCAGFILASNVSAQDSVESRIRNLLGKMTLEEKVSLLSGTGFETRPIARLGIPSLTMTDGPVGVRYERSTAFPASIALASSWDTARAASYGQALGREAKAKGRWMLLGPCININRIPLGGRDFEGYGEDPFLTSRIAVAFVRGVQSEHVAACAKHYAANNQEYQRVSISVETDERTLREIYLPAFKAAVQEGESWAVMSAYNKVNGLWCSENPFLLTDVLKKEWGFRGIVVSDWGAVHSTLPTAKAGLDVEMPTGEYLGGTKLLDEVRSGSVAQSLVDDKVTRILRVMFLTGLFEKQAAPDKSVVNSPAHQSLARDVAGAGTVLLKNDGGILPIDLSAVRSIALIGPSASVARTGGGGSAFVDPFYSVSPLEAAKSLLPGTITIRYAQGCRMAGDVTPIQSSALTPAGGKPGEKGLRGEYFANQNLEGPPAFTRLDSTVDFEWGDGSPSEGFPTDHFSIRWTGTLTPPASGDYEISIRSDDGSRLYLDGKQILDNWGDHGSQAVSVQMALEKGKSYDVRLEYYENTGGANMTLGWLPASNQLQSEAARVAKGADLALVFVGTSNSIETEGVDRTSLALPSGQDELIGAVVKANPRTVVVLATGAPVLMPWAESVPAIVEAWFGGQESGNAIMDVLTGRVNPAGKLPVTFPKSLKDSPAYPTYPGKDGKTSYAEGVFVGYRGFDRAKADVLFPFGHGLSYTTFAYANLRVSVPEGAPRFAREVSLEVTNTGGRSGDEVVQLYVSQAHPSVVRPVKELKAFARVSLAPGERKTLRFELDESSFAFFHPQKKQWTVEPGAFEILLGSSSRDIRARSLIELK